MELFVDRRDSRTLTDQLYQQLRDAIAEGTLGAGDRLTSSRTVSAELGVARSTVSEAYARLVAEGYVEGHAGGGSVVAALTSLRPRTRTQTSALAPTPRAAAIAPYDRRPDATATFDLRPGRVDESLFPAAAWRQCVLRALDRTNGQYGDPAGTEHLRAALAHWVARSRAVVALPDEILVTSGAGHAIDLIARVLVEPGQVVAVEEPGYPPVVGLLTAHGAEVVGVPVDAHGIVVESIPAQARFVYVTPSHQYPLGMVMARNRRCELLQWASDNNAAIVEDDYDSEFRHTVHPLEPLQRLDRDGRVIYVSSFSKSLSPALRLGFMVVPRPLLPAMRAVRQAIDWCPPIAAQAALAAFVEGGHLDRHLRRARAVYRDRHDRLWAALGAFLPPGYRCLPAPAGLHYAVVGDETPRYAELKGDPLFRDILLGSLRRCYQFSPPTPGFLVGFGALATPQIQPACRALARILAR